MSERRLSGEDASAMSQSDALQQATERLASLFIEENVRDRANISEDTNRFLESQLKDARNRLAEQERKVEQYRLRYSGQLPSQASANLQAIQNVQLQLQSLREATDRARERRLLVVNLILHVAPESAIGGPLALVETGDWIRLDVPSRQLTLEVDDAELARRRAAWTPPAKRYERGYGWMFSRHIRQADEGCDFDFLETGFRAPVREPV